MQQKKKQRERERESYSFLFLHIQKALPSWPPQPGRQIDRSAAENEVQSPPQPRQSDRSSMSRPAAASDLEKGLKAAATDEEEEEELAVVYPRLATRIKATVVRLFPRSSPVLTPVYPSHQSSLAM
jgi:hypothetical protein